MQDRRPPLPGKTDWPGNAARNCAAGCTIVRKARAQADINADPAPRSATTARRRTATRPSVTNPIIATRSTSLHRDDMRYHEAHRCNRTHQDRGRCAMIRPYHIQVDRALKDFPSSADGSAVRRSLSNATRLPHQEFGRHGRYRNAQPAGCGAADPGTTMSARSCRPMAVS